MRTTLDLDPTALALVRQLAAHRGESLGRVVSDLILSGARTPIAAQRTRRNGFPVRPAVAGQAPITTELVQRLLEDEV
ncbi:hypothetical protein HLB44_14970 [Aquincola sp. S2]|uniref:Antitoxin n=1 Tax=Pseudaquabacterium terrae TaxID=2732868 RepID=A0ABX2EI54_9BURK|nr:hypothetical protein [Aquabacterium terrae]NRF68293.1 hypothetical protein [Aquabacterium terrae]